MRVVVAPDKFKGSLTAVEAAEAIGEGLRQGNAEVDVVLAPVADGGDGTVDTAVAAGYDRVTTTATGPTGEPVTASFAVSDDTAVVEMAEAAGLRRLPGSRPAPLTATTYGVGELIRAALDRRVTRVVLGVGGSATTDGGTGMARALGVRFLDAEGRGQGLGARGRPRRRAGRPVGARGRGGPGRWLRRGAHADAPRTGSRALPPGGVGVTGPARPTPRSNLAAVPRRRRGAG